ncbi:hypothetical protein, partial [Corynebacterium glyciniphilum]|uniref:hypothetical protein n=1 Tax=Corynebacterium glyciniphilum TaxID=1404244 RepID=UPI001642AB39
GVEVEGVEMRADEVGRVSALVKEGKVRKKVGGKGVEGVVGGEGEVDAVVGGGGVEGGGGGIVVRVMRD